MTDNNSIGRRPPSLPTELSGWKLKVKNRQTFNDRVQALHEALISDEKLKDEYLALLFGVDEGSYVEGSEEADDFSAATMLRNYATRQHDTVVEKAKLHPVQRALRVVLRRYVDGSRSDRAQQMAAE